MYKYLGNDAFAPPSLECTGAKLDATNAMPKDRYITQPQLHGTGNKRG